MNEETALTERRRRRPRRRSATGCEQWREQLRVRERERSFRVHSTLCRPAPCLPAIPPCWCGRCVCRDAAHAQGIGSAQVVQQGATSGPPPRDHAALVSAPLFPRDSHIQGQPIPSPRAGRDAQSLAPHVLLGEYQQVRPARNRHAVLLSPPHSRERGLTDRTHRLGRCSLSCCPCPWLSSVRRRRCGPETQMMPVLGVYASAARHGVHAQPSCKT